MKIRTGVCGDDQMSGFDNATLQSGGCNKLEFSIATFVEIPLILHGAPEEVIEKWLREKILGPIEEFDNSVKFEVEIGPAHDGTPEKKEENV